MRFLPQANPLYQNLSTATIVLPDILDKLGKGGFTGYVHHAGQNFEAYCIYAKGKLICAMANDGTKEKTGFEAIVMMFDSCISTPGEINVYRMTTDLAMCAHAMVVGKKLSNGEEVRQTDIKAMLARIKAEEIHGVVRFYTENRSAMMFYRAGIPIGFYHDTAKTIETSPDEARRVAALPGARLDVSVTAPLEELLRYDLLQMVNLQKLWQTASSRSSRKNDPVTALSAPAEIDEAKCAELAADLKEVAMAYLARPGAALVDTVLLTVGGVTALYDSGSVSRFLVEIKTGAVKLDPDAKIDEMLDLMQSEIAGRLAV